VKPEEYESMYWLENEHWWYSGMRRITATLLERAELPRGPRILDAGCGTGYNLAWLRGLCGGRVEGLDLFPEALEFCRRRGETLLVRGTISALPHRAASFDLVTAFDSLSSIEGDAARTLGFQEIHRVLAPRGYLLARVAAFEWLRTTHDDDVCTHHRYGARELRNTLSAAGFETLRLTFANALLFPAAVVWRGLKRAGLARAGSDVRPNTRGPGWLNRMMDSLMRLEAAALRNPRFAFPMGLSVIALAQKR
jgi:SAM-dependent methyltransferase